LECLISPGDEPDETLSFTIVDIEDFEISYDENHHAITGTVTYSYNGRTLSQSCEVMLRSGEGGETAA
jgi:hypothetical protein